MKNFRIALLFSSFLALGLVFSACGGGTDKSANTDKTGKEYTSAYVCPMHCEGSGSDAAGKCPVCKMDYVVNENHKADGHNHDGHNHDGHNHDGHNH